MMNRKSWVATWRRCGIAIATSVVGICGTAIAQIPEGFVDASSFGYTPNDATVALQSAISSGFNVYVPNMGTPWLVRPIKLNRSNQEIRFESGVVVEAKPGSFTYIGDTLFDARGVSNVRLVGYGATWKMQKSAYTQPPYVPNAQRHGIITYGVSNFTIEGLRIQNTGGDGIELAGAADYSSNENVTIKNVFIDNAYRNGISVIDAKNVLIDNAVIRNTSGAPPTAGIDLEPDVAGQFLENITIRNSIIDANGGYGIVVADEAITPGSNSPITALVDHVTVVGNGGGILTANYAPGLTITNSLLGNNGQYGFRSAGSIFAPANTITYSSLWNNALGNTRGRVSLGTGSQTIAPTFYSTDPNSPFFMYLDPSTSSQISLGASDGSYMGARPVFMPQLLAADNTNGEVNAADYVAWRDSVGTTLDMLNDATPGNSSYDDYSYWRSHFGRTMQVRGSIVTDAVPEPLAVFLALTALYALPFSTSLRSTRSSCRR